MSVLKDDPFEVLVVEQTSETDAFSELTRRNRTPAEPTTVPGAATARLHGFDLEERPLLADLPGLPHDIVAARTTIALLREQIGATVVVLFDKADLRSPIVVGVLQESLARGRAVDVSASLVSAQVDDQRVVLSAEREIVLRCGEASITLTRAGKVIIKGAYILSRASGYNKIKGAAVDIN
jgi:hypothetical protein